MKKTPNKKAAKPSRYAAADSADKTRRDLLGRSLRIQREITLRAKQLERAVTRADKSLLALGTFIGGRAFDLDVAKEKPADGQRQLEPLV